MCVALGKRTYGDFLDAGPSLQRRISRNSPEVLWVPRIRVAPSFFRMLHSLRKRVGILTPPGQQLLADTEFRNHGFIPLGIVFLQIVEQATPLADQHEKPAA